jgi:hypothetical protein
MKSSRLESKVNIYDLPSNDLILLHLVLTKVLTFA